MTWSVVGPMVRAMSFMVMDEERNFCVASAKYNDAAPGTMQTARQLATLIARLPQLRDTLEGIVKALEADEGRWPDEVKQLKDELERFAWMPKSGSASIG